MSNAGLTEAECREIAEETERPEWVPTAMLRFVKRVTRPNAWIDQNDPTVREVRILQVRWFNLKTGEREWRDVPLEEE
jgi:hypothetical protein